MARNDRPTNIQLEIAADLGITVDEETTVGNLAILIRQTASQRSREVLRKNPFIRKNNKIIWNGTRYKVSRVWAPNGNNKADLLPTEGGKLKVVDVWRLADAIEAPEQ